MRKPKVDDARLAELLRAYGNARFTDKEAADKAIEEGLFDGLLHYMVAQEIKRHVKRTNDAKIEQRQFDQMILPLKTYSPTGTVEDFQISSARLPQQKASYVDHRRRQLRDHIKRETAAIWACHEHFVATAGEDYVNSLPEIPDRPPQHQFAFMTMGEDEHEEDVSWSLH